MKGRFRGIAVTVLCAFAFTFPMPASSFALRTMEKGDKVPDLEFAGLTGEGGKLSSFVGEKGLIVIYWATWSSRSPALLSFAEKNLRAYEKLGMKILAVDADHEEMKAEDVTQARAKAVELGLSFPVVLDAGLKGYNAIGIISTPTTLILDKELRVIDAYPGFPSIARDDIPERLDAFLGIVREKRAEKTQYLLDHKPKNYALQYYNLGKRLYLVARTASGELPAVPEQAIERLDEAIRRDPDYFRSYLLKAIILHQAKGDGRLDAALKALKDRDFQEVYERRVLGFGYLYLGMDNVAADHLQAASGILPDDPAILFGQAVAAARMKKPEAAKKALAALRKIAGAKEALGFDYEALFTEAGELRPGTAVALRSALDKLLEIEKQGQGMIRSDAPVPAAPSSAPPAPSPAAAPPAPSAPAPVPAAPSAPAPAPAVPAPRSSAGDPAAGPSSIPATPSAIPVK